MDVVRKARKFRSDARRRGTPARAELTRRYARIVEQVRRDGEWLDRHVRNLYRDGQVPSADLIRRLEGYQLLQFRLERELLDAARTVFDLVDGETRREVVHALKDARALLNLDDADRFDEFDRVAMENLTGVGASGPVRDRLTRLAGPNADQVMQHIVDGLVLNRSYSQTADLIEASIVNGSHAHALRIVRTETARARREACRLVYLQTSGVTGWIWICSLTPTSCGLCWAMHGKVFRLDEPMPTHPNCSCECAPYTGPSVDLGVDLFDALTPDEQDAAIGASHGRAYRAGAITLPDLVHTGRDPEWGPTGTQRSLVGILGPEASRWY